MKMKNIRADSKLLSIWWFAILGIIATVVVVSTLMFYSGKLDVRLIESDILSERVIDCFVDNGFLRQDILGANFDLFSTCGISKSMIENSGNFYMNVTVFSEDKKQIKSYVYGNQAFAKECAIGDVMKKSTNYPLCISKKIEVLSRNQNKFSLNVLAGSNNEFRLLGGK
jgi:hypothetical protein